MSNNKVTLIGHLGGDPAIIEKDDKLFAAFSMATTESYKDKEDNWQNKEPVWHRIICFSNNTVELARAFKKGARVEVTGALSYRPFEIKQRGKKPVKKQEATVIAYNVEARPLS